MCVYSIPHFVPFCFRMMKDEGANGAVSEKETMGKQEVLIKLQRYYFKLGFKRTKRKKGCKEVKIQRYCHIATTNNEM